MTSSTGCNLLTLALSQQLYVPLDKDQLTIQFSTFSCVRLSNNAKVTSFLITRKTKMFFFLLARFSKQMDLEEISSFDCCILWFFKSFLFFINPCFTIFHFLNKHTYFFPCRLCWPNTWYDCQAQLLINPNSPISLPWNDKNLSKVKETASFNYFLL